MSIASDFKAAVADLPKFTKAVVAFATSAAASESTIALIAQYSHIIPPGWTQGIAVGISVIAAFGAILTELGSTQSVTEKAKEVFAEISELLEVANHHGVVTITPVVPAIPVAPSRQQVTSAVNAAVQPVVNDATAVVSDVASAAASRVVEQVIADFKK